MLGQFPSIWPYRELCSSVARSHWCQWQLVIILSSCESCVQPPDGSYIKYTHPDSSDRLRRSHITQCCCGYCKLQYRWGYYKGTLMLLWQKAERLLCMQWLQSILIVPAMVLWFVVATVVLCHMRPKELVRRNLDAEWKLAQTLSHSVYMQKRGCAGMHTKQPQGHTDPSANLRTYRAEWAGNFNCGTLRKSGKLRLVWLHPQFD